MLKDVDVAIIGAGFCGSMLAVRLAGPGGNRSVALIDGSGSFGAGVAFGTTHPSHLLNVPAGKMSAYPETPDHFLTWLRSNRRALDGLVSDDVQGTDFVPRAAYGKYLRAQLERAPLDGADIEVVVRAAVDASVDEYGVTIWFDDGSRVRADSCVLATGNDAPFDVPGIGAELKRSPFYCADPWRPDLVERAGRARSVLLIGSGLTAVDVALTVRAANPDAAIHMISRRGRLPHAHRTVAPHAVDFSSLVGTRSILDLSRRIRAELFEAAERGGDWRCVVDALRPHTQAIWGAMEPRSRSRFLRHLRMYWEIHRHRVAPAVDHSLRDLLSSATLRVHAGRIVSSFARQAHAAVSYRRREDGNFATVKADLVVNCTGPTTDVTRSRSPLWRNLIARGVVRPDPLGLGLETGKNGAVLNASGFSSQRLYALGGLRRPDLFETTAVPELRQQVRDLAETLHSSGARAAALPA